ncbi:MAG: aquaporin, partial [Deltaproteobacteria bacterium]|nr:aquaporin [Deltaproteobacteria bacterium]
GLVVAAMIYSLGAISGAHLNPAVTIGFWLSRRMALRRVPAYIAGQCAGAILASLAVKTLFPGHPTIGATIPAGAYSQSFMLELIMSFILMFVILSVSTGEKEKGTMAGVAIGSVVAFEAMLGGPVSGASMNPARSLGPALISWHVQGLWIYFIAPISGAALAVIACRYLHRGTGACYNATNERGNADG